MKFAEGMKRSRTDPMNLTVAQLRRKADIIMQEEIRHRKRKGISLRENNDTPYETSKR